MTDNQTQCEKCCVRDGDNKMYYECCCAEDAITVMKDNERARREGYVEVNGRWIKKHRLVIKCSKCVCHVPVNQFNIEKKMCMDCDSKKMSLQSYCHGCNTHLPLREFSLQANPAKGFKKTKLHGRNVWCNSCNQSVIADRNKVARYISKLEVGNQMLSEIKKAIRGEQVEMWSQFNPEYLVEAEKSIEIQLNILMELKDEMDQLKMVVAEK